MSAISPGSSARPPLVDAELENLIRSLPGYDPCALAGDGWFDHADARKAIEFIEACCILIEDGFNSKAGDPFLLENWERAIIANVFGWKIEGESGQTVRRFQEAFIYVARKNGKTPLLAAIACYVFFCDGEIGQQNYCAAGEREQASLVFRHISGMVAHEPEMARRCKPYKAARSLVNEADGSFIRVLSADADTKHGGNSHLVMIDELHVQKNQELVDTLKRSTSSRKQPLVIYITTADCEGESICNEIYDRACAVRDNKGDPLRPGFDRRFLPVIFEVPADKADEIVGEENGRPVLFWQTEAAWRLANPNLGVSKSLEYMRRECRLAQEKTSVENDFKRFDLNVRTQQANRWLKMEQWDRCAGEIDLDKLQGRTCCGGLDLGATSDLTSLCLNFPLDGIYHLAWWNWIPRDKALEMEKKYAIPYLAWERLGFIKLTDGNEIDYDLIYADIDKLAQQYGIEKIGADRVFQGAQLCQQLIKNGMAVEQVNMGWVRFAAPTVEFERRVNAGLISHGNNPVARFAACNAKIIQDNNGLMRPVKPTRDSHLKVDPIIVAVIATSMVMTNENSKSVYDTREVRWL